MATVHQITSPVEGISCHAWNKDRSQIALSPNNNEIHIYGVDGDQFNRLHVLTEHDLLVSSIDWSATNNKIVSCSHDRNAFVWTFDAHTNTWKPALVVLRIDRAALDVKWSLDGLRFAVTSGAKCVPVCTYESSNDWWVSKMIKKFKSTVLCCAFHPKNGQILATGCADFKCRVFSTFSMDVDGTNVDAGSFGTPLEFGEVYAEMNALGWINAVAWSPSGNVLAFAGHDSSIQFATFSSNGPIVQKIRFSFLPLNKLMFIGENAVIGAGFDFNPMIFNSSKKTWKFHSFVDKKPETKKITNNNGVAAARAMFQNKATRGQDTKSDSDILWTKHENAITGISAVSKTPKEVNIISTSALDGRLVFWDLPSLEINMSSLDI